MKLIILRSTSAQRKPRYDGLDLIAGWDIDSSLEMAFLALVRTAVCSIPAP